jgi:hypothetical protein
VARPSVEITTDVTVQQSSSGLVLLCVSGEAVALSPADAYRLIEALRECGAAAWHGDRDNAPAVAALRILVDALNSAAWPGWRGKEQGAWVERVAEARDAAERLLAVPPLPAGGR